MDTNTGTPTLAPPGAVGGGGGGTTEGLSRPTIADAVAAGATDAGPQGPTMSPPGAQGARTGAESATGITATWHNGVTVDALWAINETRNAFMRVVGVGWKKLYNGKDGAFTALVMLASQARQTGKTVNYRDEADGMVYEIYLW